MSSIFFANAFTGFNLLDKSVQLRVDAGIECIWEVDGLIPIPGIGFSIRFYPINVFSTIKKLRFAEEKPKEVIVEKIVEVEKEVVVEVEKLVEIEKVVEVEKIIEKEIFIEIKPELPPPPPEEPISPILQAFLDRNFLTLEFGVAEDSLSEKAIYILDEIGKYLEEHPEEKILVEGHAAPFDTKRLQYVMGLKRAEFIRDYLHENYNIARKRVICESRGATQSGKIVPTASNDYYAQYRKAVILRVLPEVEVENTLESEIELETENALESEIEVEVENTLESEIEVETKNALESGIEVETENALENEIEVETENALENEIEVETENTLDREIEVETENALESEIELETETTLESEIEVETENILESEIEVEAENALKSEIEVETENTLESEIEVETENALENEIEVETENALESEIEVETENALESEI